MGEIKNITAITDVSNNTYIENLKRTKKQEVLDIIDAIVYEHRIGISAMMGPLSAKEAEREYEKLLNALPLIPGLTKEEQEELTVIIKNKIKEIPNVEEEKRAEYQAYECMAEEAFIAAKARFEELGPARKLKLILAGKDPDNIDISFKTVQEINRLYRKDERD